MKKIAIRAWARTTVAMLVPLVFNLASAPPAAAQEEVVIDQQTYQREGAKWFVSYQGTRFEVNPRVVTIKLAESVPAAAKSSIFQAEALTEIRANRLGYVDVAVPPGADVLDFVRRLKKNEAIESAEVNTIGEYVAPMLPDDPTFPSQWHLPQINVAANPALGAWSISTGSVDVLVAVLDSGTDVAHQDLIGNSWVNPGEDVDGDRALDPTAADHLDAGDANGLDDDGNGFVDDLAGWDFHHGDNNVRGPYYHGTHVTGIVAARSNNGLGVAGLAGGWAADPGVRVMAVGVGDFGPDGSILDDAIIYAADNGARVITMSLTVAPSAAIDAALAYAWNTRGAFIDCAAGNSYGGAVGYPANNGNVVAVSSTGPADTISGFSSVGPEVELAAPGEVIWSTRIGDTYGQGDGTSYAAPQVAGVAALLLSCDATLSHQAVRQLLQTGAVDLGAPGPDTLYGFGRIDALASLRAAGCRTLLRHDVGLFVGGLLTDNSASYNSGADIGFRYRNRFRTVWSWESEFGVAFTDDGIDDALLASGQFHVVRHLPGSPSAQPFVLAGVGVAHYNTIGFSDTGPLATLGLGTDYRWRPRVGFRLDLRLLALHDVVDPGWTTNGQVLWGTTFSF